MSPPAVRAHGLSRSFGHRRAVVDVDLVVAPGERLALMGPNGAGKTTLLRMLAGLLRPEAGRVEILGHDLREQPRAARGAIGYLGHQPLAYLDLTVRQNLELFADLYGVAPDAVDSALERVGLLARSLDSARELSRGMLQRLSIARALINDPVVLLLDEPGAGLDARGAELLAEAVTAGGAGRAAVLVSHDPVEVLALAERAVVMRSGAGVAEIPLAGMSAADLASAYAEALR